MPQSAHWAVLSNGKYTICLYRSGMDSKGTEEKDDECCGAGSELHFVELKYTIDIERIL